MAAAKKKPAPKATARKAPAIPARELRAIRLTAIETAGRLPTQSYGGQWNGLNQMPLRTAASIIQDARMIEAYLVGA